MRAMIASMAIGLHIMSQWWCSCPRLPPPVVPVDRDQP
jgi:hypothetical protein